MLIMFFDSVTFGLGQEARENSISFYVYRNVGLRILAECRQIIWYYTPWHTKNLWKQSIVLSRTFGETSGLWKAPLF